MTPLPDPLDPARLDAFLEAGLEGEVDSGLEQRIARDPGLREAARARRAFLAALGRAGARERAARALPPGLAERIRAHLGGRPRPALLRPTRVAAAAVLLLGVGLAALLVPARGPAEALPPEIRAAADLLSGPLLLEAPAGCADRSTSPFHFPPVREQVLKVGRCVEESSPGADGPDTRAVLFRPEDTVRLGYVAVPAAGSANGPEIGLTELGGTVVFDLSYGRTRYYLAAPAEFVRAQGTCAACHGEVARAAPNPHKIVRRLWER